MEELNKKRIYKMRYDCPHNPDGTMRENKYLGTFKIIQQISEDMYFEEFIGLREEDNKKYVVIGREISGVGGGVRYEITEIK